jgi:class 3 adenylate cyclase/WD40 repeat protein
VWDVESGELKFRIEPKSFHVYTAIWSPDGKTIASSLDDGRVCLYAAQDGRILDELMLLPPDVIEDESKKSAKDQARRVRERSIRGLSWSPDGKTLACATDPGILLWEKRTRKVDFVGGPPGAISVSFSPDGGLLACTQYGESVYIIDRSTRRARFRVHSAYGPALAWSVDSRLLAYADGTAVSIMDVERQVAARVLEGHTQPIRAVSFSADGKLLASREGRRRASGGPAQTLLWSTTTWEQVAHIDASASWYLYCPLAFAPAAPLLATSSSGDRIVYVWDVSDALKARPRSQTFYKNAKVALVGDSGVGKSGLGLVLSGKNFAATESTHGRRIWSIESKRIKPPDSPHSEIHELLLWDLAGQPGYRLIHQLHLEDVSLGLILFDARSELDPFAGVRHWHRALTQATRSRHSVAETKEILVAARIDRGPVGIGPARVKSLMAELGLADYVETSAKEGTGIARLSRIVRSAVDWNSVPTVTSNLLFQRIKRHLLKEKLSGRVLATADELLRGFMAKQPKELPNFREQFSTCIGRLQALGLLRRFTFGDLVLLQPEILDAYASSIIFAAKDEPDGMGSISEDNVRLCKFAMPTDERVQDTGKERLLLLATIEDLVTHEIALREPANDAQLLVFPSQLTRQNPDLPDPAGKSSVVRFQGALLNIYATLVVRLSHSGIFRKQDMWKNAATFSTKEGGRCGLFLTETDEGSGSITTFFDGDTSTQTILEFESFIYSHITQRALKDSVSRNRVFVCPDCNTPVANAAVAKRRERGFDWIDCNVCERRIPLAEEAGEIMRTETAHIERVATRRRELDSALISATGEMHSDGFKKWAGATIATLALVFTDIVGSTPLNVEVGDERMSEIRGAHFRQGRVLIKQFDGYLIKTIGDALMVAFRNAKDALDFALKLHAEPGAAEIKARAGVHIGPVQIEEEDAFGSMVNYAARVVSAAKGDQVFASDRAYQDIRQLGSKSHAGIAWNRHATELKGFKGEQILWEAASVTASQNPKA